MPLSPLKIPQLAVAANVINYNTAALTLRCVKALLATDVVRILVLDNASEAADRATLVSGLDELAAAKGRVECFISDQNLGFAGGSNRLIAASLADPSITHCFLINSDSFIDSAGFALFVRQVSKGNADLWGARVHQDRDGVAVCDQAQVESMGIALYRPLLASNRKHAYETFVGPTGGCALYSRKVLEDLLSTHGYCFDPDYFCYAEDTDLCLRAHLLGYCVAYCDEGVAWHLGQASSGGSFNDFVYYHGIRNSIWTIIKCVPASVLFRNLGWIFLLHLGIVVRHSLRGKMILTFQIYRDVCFGLGSIIRKRKVVQSSRRSPVDCINKLITPRFYEYAYLRKAIKQLFFRSA